MDFFGLLTMIGGLALFLYGMNTMGDGLTKVSGGKLESILAKLTSNPIKGVILGAGVTAIIQSSSATTVMVVGFVNSGLMKLSQAVGVIMGANIGTTITSWILSLTGIESDSFFLKMLKPTSFSPILAIIGIVFLMFCKSEMKKDVAKILIGFAVLMFGLNTMSDAIAPLAEVPEFTNILVMFSNPVLGIIAGAVLTAIIQSSSASVGILQAMCSTGALSFGAAFPIIMGQNIGTCVTALISGVGAGKNAKRAALVHLYFNVIGTIVFVSIFYIINAVVRFEFLAEPANTAGIAVIHTAFNVAATLMLLPFTKMLEKLACLTIRDDAVQAETALSDVQSDGSMPEALRLLDVRFLENPSYAVSQAKHVAVTMSKLANEALRTAVGLLFHYKPEQADYVSNLEHQVDLFEDALGNWLIRVSNRKLSEKENKTVSVLLHCIGDFERISDHAVNLMEAASELYEKGDSLGDKSEKELGVYTDAVLEIADLAGQVFEHDDLKKAKCVEPLEDVIDELNMKVKDRHIKRLRKGKCTIERGFVFSDIITDLERIADHCSNVALCELQMQEDSFEMHGYLDHEAEQESGEFAHWFHYYQEKYTLAKKKKSELKQIKA